MRSRLFWASIPAALAVALAPSRAEACSLIECERLVDLELVADGAVPAGLTALVLRPVLVPLEEFPLFNATKAPAAVTVTVTPTMGGPAVPGEVVAIDELDLLVWRPGVPLAPDTEYEVAVGVDNSMLDWAECGPDGFERVFKVTTGMPLEVPLVVPEVMTAAGVMVEPWLRPDTMVCCDGAFPLDLSGGCGESVAWSQGICAAGSGFASLAVTATIDPAVVEAAKGQVGYHFFGTAFAPGASEAKLRSHEPFCAPLTAIHLRTGEVMSGPEVCVGQELAGMLGEVAVDPAPGLAMCIGEPYTCALDESGLTIELWDHENCAPWPEGQATAGDGPTTGGATGTGDGGGVSGGSGEASGSGGGEPGEKGCACAADPSGSPWWLAGFVLLLPRRRATRR